MWSTLKILGLILLLFFLLIFLLIPLLLKTSHFSFFGLRSLFSKKQAELAECVCPRQVCPTLPPIKYDYSKFEARADDLQFLEKSVKEDDYIPY